jgi:hypothetical protein
VQFIFIVAKFLLRLNIDFSRQHLANANFIKMGLAMSKSSAEPEQQSAEGGGEQVILEIQMKILMTSPFH